MIIEAKDPRPVVDGSQIVGAVCTQCGHRWVSGWPTCERCLADGEAARFGPGGQVWASATVHLRIEHREPPFTLAYVDLDDGPRVLAQVRPHEELPPGERVRIVGGDRGDVVVSRERADDDGVGGDG